MTPPDRLALRIDIDAIIDQRRIEAEKGLSEIRRLPVVGPRLTDNDLYDDDGLPISLGP